MIRMQEADGLGLREKQEQPGEGNGGNDPQA